ncbi:male-enhanced antigen 1 [Eucyclogobius newberryi]|uniref:male-enhanced antigen 1 n=1 Tax=Eucyclogobius newberryi TaxID=166745 RepID=UPI003B5A0683
MGPERVFPSSEDDVRDEERFPTATAWSEEEEEPNGAGGGAYLYQPLNQEPISHEPINDEEEEQEAEPEAALHQRIDVMGLHLPEAPPPEAEDEDRDWAEAQRSRASIPMDSEHVELVKRTMASLSFPSLGVPPWAQQISDDQWQVLVQTTLQRHQKN